MSSSKYFSFPCKRVKIKEKTERQHNVFTTNMTLTGLNYKCNAKILIKKIQNAQKVENEDP